MIFLHLEDNEYPFVGFEQVRHIARGIVMNDEGRIAIHLLHRNDAFCDQTYYETPGGGVDDGESFVEACIRECKEEIGADVDILCCLGEVEDAYNRVKRKNINRFYLAKAKNIGDTHFVSRGDMLIQKTEWMTLEEAIAAYQAQDDRLVAGLVKRRELPILEEVKRLRDAHRIAYPGGAAHHGTKEVETPRLLLRRFTEDDAYKMFENWAGDKEITEFLEWPPHADCSVTRSVVSTWVKKYGDPTFYQWVIEEKESKEPIGSISIIHSDFDALELGFCLAKKSWGKGYATEAVRALLSYFFENVGVGKVWGKIDVVNTRASETMKRSGFAFEKNIPHGGFNQRGICDVDIYSMTKERYFEEIIGK